MQTENDNETKHPKQDFQVERLAFFTDAVFAIAITLLVIEFKIPEINKDSTAASVMVQLEALTPNLVALLFSFYLITVYWVRHHFLFKHVHNYNMRIVGMNMAGLLPIIFFPFTTSFFAQSLINPNVYLIALRLFIINNVLAGVCFYLLYWLVMVKHKEFSFAMQRHEKIKYIMDTLFLTILFAVIFVVTFYTTSNMVLGCIVAVWAIGKKIVLLVSKSETS